MYGWERNKGYGTHEHRSAIKKFGLTKLIKHNPTEIIKGLKHFDQLHFFPFGGIKELTNWIEKREENNVRI